MRRSGSPVGFWSSACMCGHTCMNGSVEVPMYIHKTHHNQRGIRCMGARSEPHSWKKSDGMALLTDAQAFRGSGSLEKEYQTQKRMNSRAAIRQCGNSAISFGVIPSTTHPFVCLSKLGLSIVLSEVRSRGRHCMRWTWILESDTCLPCS